MAILVTGGAGFIGSHTVDALIRRGYEVVVVDDLSTGKREYVNPEAKFYRISILDTELERVFEENEIESVIHMAAQISVEHSLKEPVKDAEINVLGSLNLLELCRKHNVEKIVFSSSVAVYGEPQYLPVDENHALLPISPYGVTKLAVEKYLYHYWQNYGIDYVSLRYANVYGPRQRSDSEGGVVAIFVTKVLRNEEVTVYGDGNQTRDFVYVEDVAEANALALEKSARNKEFNVSTCRETSVNQLLSMIAGITNRGPKIKHGEPRREIRRCCFGYESISSQLGWKPKHALEQGLRKTVEWYQSKLRPPKLT